MKKYKILPLSEILTYKNNFIKIDDSKQYKRVKIKLHRQGMVLRDEVKGYEIKTKSQQVCKAVQFLVAEIDAKVGGYGIVPEELEGAVVSSHYFLFDIDVNKVDLNYFEICMRSDYFFSQIKAEGSTNYASIRPKDVLKINIPLPSLEEQKLIAQKVNHFLNNKKELDSLTNTNEELIQKLRSSILQEAVQGKLVPQNPNDEPASELFKKIKAEKDKLIKEGKIKKQKPLTPITEEEKSYELPKGWEWVKLGEIFKFIDYRGKTPTKINVGIRLITAKNVKQGYISTEPQEFISPTIYDSWMTRGFPKKGDILITTEAPLGHIAIFNIEEKVAFAQRVIILQNFANLNSGFLRYMLMSNPIQKLIIGKQSGMTAKGIKSSKLKLIPVPIPSLSEQIRIVEKVDKLMAYCDDLEKQVKENQENSEKLMSSVLKEAFNNGRI